MLVLVYSFSYSKGGPARKGVITRERVTNSTSGCGAGKASARRPPVGLRPTPGLAVKQFLAVASRRTRQMQVKVGRVVDFGRKNKAAASAVYDSSGVSAGAWFLESANTAWRI